jgi:2-iminobutanoate/2-iminopropanoate deaminase
MAHTEPGRGDPDGARQHVAGRLGAGSLTAEIQPNHGSNRWFVNVDSSTFLFESEVCSVRQKSLEVRGLSHVSAPIPLACRIGPVLATSGIGGKNADTGEMPSSAEAQAANCFENLGRVLAAGGLGLGDVVLVTVYIADESHRAAVNGPWLQHYPNPEHRPARHALVVPLRGGMLVQLEALAVASDA